MMNAYRERQLDFHAECGVRAVKQYGKEREGKCHIDGLPDCPFLHKDGAHEDLYCLVGYPAKWALEGVDTR